MFFPESFGMATTEAQAFDISAKDQPVRSAWYASAMEHLVEVVQDLSHVRDLPAIMAIVRQAARDLTGADGATFVLREGEYCYYAEENAISPLWKGQRFPLKMCISGWVMMNAQPAVIEDIYVDDRIPHNAYKPTFVKSLAMVPIRQTFDKGGFVSVVRNPVIDIDIFYDGGLRVHHDPAADAHF